jgi:hypothetical protein
LTAKSHDLMTRRSKSVLTSRNPGQCVSECAGAVDPEVLVTP